MLQVRLYWSAPLFLRARLLSCSLLGVVLDHVGFLRAVNSAWLFLFDITALAVNVFLFTDLGPGSISFRIVVPLFRCAWVGALLRCLCECTRWCIVSTHLHGDLFNLHNVLRGKYDMS